MNQMQSAARDHQTMLKESGNDCLFIQALLDPFAAARLLDAHMRT
jgi:hypothetical protein